MNTALVGLAMLIIGDSHFSSIGWFDNPLQDELVGQGAVVHTFAVCNSAPDDWIVPTAIVCGRGERHNADPAILSNLHSLRGWALAGLIKQYSPNLVVIELGDNMAGYGEAAELPRALIADQVHRLLIPIQTKNLPCIWVGPPWGTEGGHYKKTYRRVKELSDYLSQIVTPCHYVDSLKFSQPGQWPTRDGLHLTEQGTETWDKYLVSSIDQIAQGLARH